MEELVFIKGRIGWKGLKKSEFGNSGVIIINGPDIKNGKVDWSNCLRVPKWRYDESEEISVKLNDILMTKDGTIGKTAYITQLPELATLASGIFLIRSSSSRLHQGYLYQYFNSNFFKELVKSRIEGSVIPHLYQRDVVRLFIPLPSLTEQQKIAKILFDLDAKIELNHKMNNTLEWMAQAVFKSWFIDYEFPDEKGMPYRSSGGEMMYSDELEKYVPKGWGIKSIMQVCDTFGGGTPSTKNPSFWEGGISWAVPSDLTKSDHVFLKDTVRKITEKGLDNCASKLHPENSIFMTSRASIGYFAINTIPCAANQGFIIIETRNDTDLFYLYCNFKHRVKEFIENANGTTFLEIGRSTFRKLPIILPPRFLIDLFHKTVYPIWSQIKHYERQIKILVELRDLLVPKLMSGKIRVPTGAKK